MKTIQEIFDIMAGHLLAQNERSGGIEGGEFRCKYLDSDGKKCAVGALISTETYDSRIEDRPFSGTLCRDILIENEIDVHDLAIFNLIDEVREIHDYAEVYMWRDHLMKIATAYGLEFKF